MVAFSKDFSLVHSPSDSAICVERISGQFSDMAESRGQKSRMITGKNGRFPYDSCLSPSLAQGGESGSFGRVWNAISGWLNSGENGNYGYYHVISNIGLGKHPNSQMTNGDMLEAASYIGGPEAIAGKAIGKLGLKKLTPVLGNKLDYLFGKAIGNPHARERSKAMFQQLARIGLPDDPASRRVLQEHFDNVLNDASNILRTQPNGRTVRESLLMGPNGSVKIESVWEGEKLITPFIYGGGG